MILPKTLSLLYFAILPAVSFAANTDNTSQIEKQPPQKKSKTTVRREDPERISALSGIFSPIEGQNPLLRSGIYENDEAIMCCLAPLGMWLDEVARVMNISTTECWNPKINESGLTKAQIVSMLRTRYPEVRGDLSMQEMLRIQSLYRYGIKLSDLGGYFPPFKWPKK